MKTEKLASRLDQLYEFDREPVRKDKLQGLSSFIGMYAGEHVAGTEFVIGPLFVAHGVSAPDFFGGLILGNFLAVLSWAFFCAPIAVKTRLTLFWYVRKICGPYITLVYNLVVSVGLCLIAGSMISVSATAVGLPFNMPMPGLNDFLPNSLSWIVIVVCLGLFVTTFAILGFKQLVKFAKICSPWMFLVFVAAGLATLPKLGCTNLSQFWEVANDKIWTGIPLEGQSKFGFWHVVAFSWLCNMLSHVGLMDMSQLRFAKKWTYGFASAFGMYLGHFIAWICSGILCAAALGDVSAGPIAYLGAGIAGAVCVVIAGWTTANPQLYKAGLAFQVLTPSWQRWKITLIAGLLTTFFACFPGIVMKLLELLAFKGLLLVPIGVIVFTDFWVLPLLGLRRSEDAVFKVFLTNWSAAVTWLIVFISGLMLPVEIYFKPLPVILLSIFLYSLFSLIEQKKLNLRSYNEEV